jgi:hypothetical protein
MESKPIQSEADRLGANPAGFSRGEKPIRLWGVNLSFGANLPSKEDAPFVAARLAAAGINSVRLHHMDTANYPRGIWEPENPTTLSAEALERLDYFIDQLAKKGIYVNLNLHVGKAHSRHLDLPETKRNYDKVFNLFTPELVEAQKVYARELLNHINPNREKRYADDPAIAIVEITNENSFFMWDGDQTLRNLPPYYAAILQGQYNQWLKKHYGSTNNLRKAWAENSEPLGQNFLKNSNLNIKANSSIPQSWHLEQHNQCKAQLSRQEHQGIKALLLKPTNIDQTSWHLQLNQGSVKVQQGRYYTLMFKAAAEKPRPISCGIGQAHDPWRNLGLSQQVNLKTDWHSFRFGFVAKADEENGRVNIAFGTDDTPFYITDIELRPGGQEGLRQNESLEDSSVKLFTDGEVDERIFDRMKFLAETEKAYFDGMREFIKKDLGCKALITGTIVFGPLGLYAQSDMDFIDTHAYWKHPHFPGRPWDSNNWIVEQKAMTDYPEQATLFNLAASRLADKPFTLTEYNHPAPSDYQAECVPMTAAFASLQNWSGVWLYTYSHSSDDWDRQHLNSYFDIDTNPGKWGFVPGSAAIYRNNGIIPLEGFEVVPLAGGDNVLTSLAKLHLQTGSNMFTALQNQTSLQYENMLNKQYAVTLTGRSTRKENYQKGPSATWSQIETNRGFFSVTGKKAWIYTGHARDFESVTKGKIRISEPAFIALTVTAMDSLPLSESKKVLITACGRCENTGMEFSADRRTVGRKWGTAPVMIETVSGSVKLPRGKWTCQALGPDMMPSHKIELQNLPDGQALKMSGEHKTMWYLLTR